MIEIQYLELRNDINLITQRYNVHTELAKQFDRQLGNYSYKNFELFK